MDMIFMNEDTSTSTTNMTMSDTANYVSKPLVKWESAVKVLSS